MKSIDEAIKHCEEVAEANEKMIEYDLAYTDEQKEECRECAEEHRQLAEWLKELKAYREARKEINGLATVWEEGEGINKCRRILFKHLEEVNADEEGSESE